VRPDRPTLRLFTIALLGLLAIVHGRSLAQTNPAKRDVDIVANDGIKLRGTYYARPNRGLAVLLFHQCSRSRSIWNPLAEKLTADGLRVLIVEPRGIGDSQGEQWDYDGNLEHALQYWRKNWSADAESAYQWLVAQPDVDSLNVGLAGGGCGAFLALLTAQRHYPTTHTIVLFSDFVDEATRSFVKTSTGLSILSAVSEQDPMSLGAAKEIHALARNPENRLMTFAAQGHGFGLLEKNPELEPIVMGWLRSHLIAGSAGFCGRPTKGEQ
jgi:dienelactone hydrolase